MICKEREFATRFVERELARTKRGGGDRESKMVRRKRRKKKRRREARDRDGEEQRLVEASI